MEKKLLAVNFTDGRTTEAYLFDAEADTEKTVALLTDRLAVNGWRPVKGSGRLLVREQGVLKPFIGKLARHFGRGPMKVA